MDDLFDSIDVLSRFGLFWAFTFKKQVRHHVFKEWRKAGFGRRALMLFEGTINALIGLLPFWVILFFVWPS